MDCSSRDDLAIFECWIPRRYCDSKNLVNVGKLWKDGGIVHDTDISGGSGWCIKESAFQQLSNDVLVKGIRQAIAKIWAPQSGKSLTTFFECGFFQHCWLQNTTGCMGMDLEAFGSTFYHTLTYFGSYSTPRLCFLCPSFQYLS